MPKTTHTVQDGEWVAKIAFERQVEEQKILDDPENKKFFEKRPNPNLLCPGDKVVISTEPKQDSGATEQTHVFRTTIKHTARLRLKLQQQLEQPLEEDYTLELGGEEFTGTSKDGLIDHEIPILSSSGALHLPKRQITIILEVGNLTEVEPFDNTRCSIKGAQARMNNLAFPAGPVDGIVGPLTRSGTGRFQSWADTYSPDNGLAPGELSPIDRIIGPLTAGCLKKIHGV